ncbi:MAG: peptide chain release factor N(5)-glutamine methyltransferase [bacterium]
MQRTAPPLLAKQPWTVLSLIEWSTNHLHERQFDEARLHTELLLAHVMDCTRLHLYTNFDRPLTLTELAQFKELLKRRLTHEPLQYILGETEFMGLPFVVNKHVLIPRQETELLVEKAIEYIDACEKENVEVLDLGTGSGNISISIANFSKSAALSSVDISHEALAVAAANAERNHVSNVAFIHADMMSDFLPGKMFDGIVSNPPYIALEEFDGLQPEVRDFEPRIATTDDRDGFTFIRRITQLADQKLHPDGFLLMEIAYNQSNEAKNIAVQSGLKNVEIFADYSGNPRILSARK